MKFIKNFRCGLEEIPALREFIRDSLPELEEIILNQIILATDEICTNAIQHGCARPVSSGFTVTIHRLSDKIEVEITDAAQSFPIEKQVAVDCQEKIRNREKGGLGLFLVQKIMDEISVEEMGRFHVIRLGKYIR
jgi:serine/threonine-protein kinase RsbW